MEILIWKAIMVIIRVLCSCLEVKAETTTARFKKKFIGRLVKKMGVARQKISKWN